MQKQNAQHNIVYTKVHQTRLCRVIYIDYYNKSMHILSMVNTKFQMDSFIKGIDYRIRSCIQDTLNNKDSRYDALTMWYISRTKFDW